MEGKNHKIHNLLDTFMEWLAAFSAFPINNNARACTVGAEDPVIKIEPIILLIYVFGIYNIFDVTATVHAIMAFHGNINPTLETRFPCNFLVAMGTFHNILNSLRM